MNIFTSENVAKYNTRGATAGVGEYVLRNGVWSMDIRPAPFYQNYGTGDSRLLQDEFIPNTQYFINLWIDGDDTKYNGNYVACGLTVHYTDDSTYNLTVVGADGKGFQHLEYLSDASKSVKKFTVYYYTSTPVYYRADSFVVPLSNTNSINKKGICATSDFTEYLSPLSCTIKNGKGYMEINELIEI